MSHLNDSGFQELENYMETTKCNAFLQDIANYRKSHKLKEIHRPMKPRALRYKVIDGNRIKDDFPFIWKLYSDTIFQLARAQSGMELEMLENEKVGVNINIMAPQTSSYRWHYDRNKVTAILYLNTV